MSKINSDIKRGQFGPLKFDAIMNFVGEHAAQIIAQAEEGYADRGRGHVMLFVKAAEVHGRTFQKGEANYFSEREAEEIGMNDNIRDASLLKRIREYDPEKECVIAAFYGTEYMPLTLLKKKAQGH